MKRALFITIGTRDITIPYSELIKLEDKAEVEKVVFRKDEHTVQYKARPLGELILKYQQQIQNHLVFPIITPFLQALKNSGSPRFDEVYLITTNQNDGVDSKYSSQDTVNFGEIIKNSFGTIYKIGVKQNFDNIQVIQAKKGIVYLDTMFEFFKEKLSNNPLVKLKEFDEIHILNQGGIDAINTALMLNALYLYGDKIRLYNVNESNGICLPLNFSKQFGYEHEKYRILHAIDRFDYSFVKASSISPKVSTLAAYAYARLNFDFTSARHILINHSEISHDLKLSELADINNVEQSTDNLIQELFWNAQIRYKQEAYVDFVQRFFRIIEQLAQNKALEHLEHFDFNPAEHHTWNKRFSNFLTQTQNQALKKHLDSTNINGVPLDVQKPNIAVFMNILRFFNKEEYDFINQIEPLSRIRNHGIGAHGFKPVSLDRIIGAVNCKNKEEFEILISQIGKMLGVSENPFNRINTIIKEMLK